METKDIIVFALIFAVAAFRLYQKYGKKGKTGTFFSGKNAGKFSKPDTGEEYEPYSKK